MVMVARVKRHFRRYKQSIERQTDGGKLRRLARKLYLHGGPYEGQTWWPNFRKPI